MRLLKVLLLVLLICGVVAGCGRRETAVTIGDREGILHFGNLSEPKDLDPHTVTGLSEYNIIRALLEGLVSEEPRDLTPVPGIAKSWEVLDGGTRYRFHLRDEAQWSNGDPVTAGDFAYAYQRMLSPDFGAPYAYMLFSLVNAEAYHKGECGFEEVGVKVVDEHTLDLVLHTAVPHFLSKLNHQAWYPVHPPTIEAHGGMNARNSPWTRPEHYVGNGPFVLDSWVPNKSVSVSKNPAYYDADAVDLNGIVFYPIGDHTIEERAFRAGQLHITGTIPVDRIAYYRDNHPELLRLDPYLGTYYYLLNNTRPPLDDPRVRRALALGINRAAITKHVTRGGEQPAWTFTPPGTGGYTARAKLDGDVEAARQLLAEAGYPDGDGFPVLTVLYNTADTHARIAETIQQMWQESLGITIELVNMEWKVYLAQRQSGDYDIARAGWIGDYLDPDTFLNLWVTDGGNNWARWSNEAYDALIRQAARSSEQDVRHELFQQAEAILMDQVPIIPIYFYVSKSLVQPSVEGWYPNLLDRHPWKHIRLSPVAE